MKTSNLFVSKLKEKTDQKNSSKLCCGNSDSAPSEDVSTESQNSSNSSMSSNESGSETSSSSESSEKQTQ